jgi:hypothetical protein
MLLNNPWGQPINQNFIMVKQQTPVNRISGLKAKDPTLATPSKPKILIFGKPGVGKTYTSIDFPRVYLIDTEGGCNLPHYTEKLKSSGGVYLGPEDGALDFDFIIEQVKCLATEKHQFKTLVIDSVSKVYNTAISNEQERLGERDQFGKSKQLPIRMMRRLVSWLDRLDMNVILISHEKTEWGKDNAGNQTAIGETFDAWDRLAYELHLNLQIVKRGGSRYAVVKKTRLQSFPDGEQFEWSYGNFSRLYGKEAIEADVKSISLASEDQLGEVNKLVAKLRISQEQQQKWFDKAKVTSFDEMASPDIEKIIKFLQKQIA